VADDDNDQDTVPATLSDYSITDTYTFTSLNGTAATGNIILEQQSVTGCSTPGSGVYDFDRTVVLNMTEAVNAPADLDAFKTTAAACEQTNVVADSELDTNLTAIAGPSSGWNNDHLLLTFADWRTVDDSNHFTSATQGAIANDLADGSSMSDLLQIVGLTDANGVEASAGNGRGVLVVDATPPLATAMTVNDNGSLTIKFDQEVRLADANGADEFTITGYDTATDTAVTYTFNITSATAGTVVRSTAFTDQYGNSILASNGVGVAGTGDPDVDAIDIAIAAGINTDGNVPASVSNSQITITVNESDIDGQVIDLSHFFNELSHSSADSVAAAPAVTPSFAIEYDNLQDANFNSWASVERGDSYDGADGAAIAAGNGNGPRLVGEDKMVPKIATLAIGAPLNAVGSYVDVDTMFLHEDTSNAFSIRSIHATEVTDLDSIYSPDTATNIAVGAGIDVELRHVWSFDPDGTGAINDAIPANNSLVVIKLDSANVDVTSAMAYIYRPEVEAVDSTGRFYNSAVQTETIIPTGVFNVDVTNGAGSYSSGAFGTAVGEVALRNDDQNNDGEDTLVIELPNPNAVTDGDFLVIQNILIDDATSASQTYYSIHIPAPPAVDLTSAANLPSATEANINFPDATIYKMVRLQAADVSNTVNNTPLRTSTEFGATFGDYRATGQLTFREELASATATWATGVDDDTTGTSTTTDETVDFTETASVNTTNNEVVDYTLDAVAAGSVSETTDQVVGRNATLTIQATDESNNTSTAVFTFRKGHGGEQIDTGNGGLANQEDVILNIISGSAID
jgi:hypothetical protein